MFVGVYYGKDEPSVHFPEDRRIGGEPTASRWPTRCFSEFGYGKFAHPVPKDAAFAKDPNKPLRWIAYNRWASDRWLPVASGYTMRCTRSILMPSTARRTTGS